MVTVDNFTRVNNDVNGNPRYVIHFLSLLKDGEYYNSLEQTNLGRTESAYELAIKRGKTLGGKKFHNKQYGGGVVFQSYNLQNLCDKLNDLLK